MSGATCPFFWNAHFSARIRRSAGRSSLWICADCHAGNLGPVADATGRAEIEIRDFDQSVIGNPAHDLIRLGLSLASTARGSDLPGVTSAKKLEQMTDAYERAFDGSWQR